MNLKNKAGNQVMKVPGPLSFRQLLVILGVIICCGLGQEIKKNISPPPTPTTKREIISSTLPVVPLWQVEFEENVGLDTRNMHSFATVLTEDMLLVETQKGIYSLNPLTGEQNWYIFGGALPETGKVTAGNKLFYMDRGKDVYEEGYIVAVDKKNGQEIWRQKIDPEHSHKATRPIIGSELLYSHTPYSSYIAALDIDTGELIWSLDSWDYGVGRPISLDLYKDNLYVFNSVKVLVLDAQTGLLKKMIDDKEMGVFKLHSDKFYRGDWVRDAETLNIISALQAPDRDLWRNCSSFRLPTAWDQDHIYTGGACGGVYALSQETYQIVWEYRPEVEAAIRDALYQGVLYSLFEDGQIHAIDPQTGKNLGVLQTNNEVLLSRSGFGETMGIIANQDIMVATFDDGLVWAFCKSPCSE